MLYVAASLFPDARLWGFAVAAHLPVYVILLVPVAGALGTLLIWRLLTATHDRQLNAKRWFMAFVCGAACGTAFALFRTQTHFLGDGYTLLGLLSTENPLVKSRELGESLAHIYLMSITGIKGEAGALLSYRIISVAAGIGFVMITVWFVLRRYDRLSSQIVAAVMILSGGYMLLFFGYVENYSMFVLSVAFFIAVGILVLQRELNRFLILLPLALAIFMHVFGIALIPATAYVLGSGSTLGNRIKGAGRTTRALISIVILVLVVAAFYNYYSANYFFRLAVLPIVPHRFTIDDYALFSVSHMLDYLNLMFLLLPSSALLIIMFIREARRDLIKDKSVVFLTILSLSTLGLAFIFDPKLGMPRDWDLFAFAGVPMAFLMSELATRRRYQKGSGMLIVSAAVVLGVLSLSLRVIRASSAELSVTRFEDYLQLDKTKNRNARLLLVNYYEGMGDMAQADEVRRQWNVDFPERVLFWEGYDLKQAGRIDSAMTFFREVIRMNPNYTDAWSNLGECYMRRQANDSAINCFRISLGLNPYESVDYNNLALCYIQQGRYKDAESELLKAYSIAPNQVQVLYNLAAVCRQLRNREKFEEYLVQAVDQPDATAPVLRDLADYYVSRGLFDEAAMRYKQALQKGLDTGHVVETMKQFPALKSEFRR